MATLFSIGQGLCPEEASGQPDQINVPAPASADLDGKTTSIAVETHGSWHSGWLKR